MLGKNASTVLGEPTEPGSSGDPPLAGASCFIERQFPVARVSAESYKERKANYSQTLTGLGKWWGRKPLVLVRATILGLLLPPSDDPKQDREIFLKLMTMDDEGLWRRKDKKLNAETIQAFATDAERTRFFQGGTAVWRSDAEIVWSLLAQAERQEFFKAQPCAEDSAIREGPRKKDTQERERQIRRRSEQAKKEFEGCVFYRLPYSHKLEHCRRPEQIDGPSEKAWADINAHLGTSAHSLPELVEDLGQQRFGHRPRVGDSFCGAGSIPFEAARMGCDAFGSDLSPVAALLSWAALNIVGGGEAVAQEVREAQQQIFEAVDRKVTDWGIEHNKQGWRADAYLYCVEVRDPETGRLVPLAPSWVIGENTRTVAELVPDERNKRFDIHICQGVTADAIKRARIQGTIADYRLVSPGSEHSTPIEALSHTMRMWEAKDIRPRPDDVFQERLYCIRWVETYYEKLIDGETVELSKEAAESLADFRALVDSGRLKKKTRRHYRAVDQEDLARESRVNDLLQDRLDGWQRRGILPTRQVQCGTDINRPTNARGWSHWHHFFNPRQLLLNGLFAEFSADANVAFSAKVVCLLGMARLADWNSRLCRWDPSAANEKGAQTFYKPSLATPVFNYCCRGLTALETAFNTDVPTHSCAGDSKTELRDARTTHEYSDVWITDPPYADAVNYHELSEYFLAWYDKLLPSLFADWYTDSKRALAIKADDPNVFRQSMVGCYRSLAAHMPEDGLQIVMFTHQEPVVWADLTMILWAAGLRVTAAWCIATETDSTLKQGNYVQGTVLLVCRKQSDAEPVFLDEINHRVEVEVRQQLDEMLALEDASEPTFADADYQLAAYAAALRVLTERPIEEIDPEREITRIRSRGEISPVEQLIRNAVKIACDHLVPRGIDRDLWTTLEPLERFYLKGLEAETHGEHRSGVFQELARSFGATDYTELLATSKANEARLKTAGEFGKRMLSGDGFGSTLVRQVLFAVHQVNRNEEVGRGLNWLKTELHDYWPRREKILEILGCLALLDTVAGMEHWRKDSESARLLSGAVRNDHV